MSTFHVTVRAPGMFVSYDAIAQCSADTIIEAIDLFGVVSITSTPTKKAVVNHG